MLPIRVVPVQSKLSYHGRVVRDKEIPVDGREHGDQHVRRYSQGYAERHERPDLVAAWLYNRIDITNRAIPNNQGIV